MVAEMLTEAIQEINRSTGDTPKSRLDLVLDFPTEGGVTLDAVVMGPSGDCLAVEVKSPTH